MKSQITLSETQKNAIDAFVAFLFSDVEQEMIVSGYAGTGKTTLTTYLLDHFDQHKNTVNLVKGKPLNLDLMVTATTNKAAKVLAEETGQDVKTIHSLLGLTMTINYKTGVQKLKKSNMDVVRNALIIIDEASFIDKELLEMIHKYTLNCKILYIGDAYQLAPVFDSSVPVFQAGIPTSTLEEPQRNSGLIEKISGQYREAVKTGVLPFITPNQKDVIYCDGEQFKQVITDSFTSPEYEDYRILAWTNDRVNQYNQFCIELHGKDSFIYEGARVITNKLIRSNGNVLHIDDHAHITKIAPDNERTIGDWPDPVTGNMVTLTGGISVWVPHKDQPIKQMLKYFAKNKQWVDYFNIKENWGDLRPTFSSTVHKSQGSTYDKVFIDIADICRCHNREDVARLLYVAFSRAKSTVYVYGEIPKKYGGVNVI